LNDTSAEYPLRSEPAPVLNLIEDVAILFQNIAFRQENLDDQPGVFIAVALERLRMVLLFAPLLVAVAAR